MADLFPPFYRFGSVPYSLSRRPLGALSAGCRLVSGAGPGPSGWKLAPPPGTTGSQDFRVIEFGLFAAVLSAHQSRERIVGCGRAGGRTERPRAVARVSAGPRALDRRCAEDWESLHALPCQMRQTVLFPNPFCTPQLSTESKPNCHVALSRISRSMIGVDENPCVHSPIVPNRCGRVSELGDEYDGNRANLLSVLLPPDQVKNAA